MIQLAEGTFIFKSFTKGKNSPTTVKLGYNEQILSQIGYFSTQINPVMTNPGYDEQKWPVPSCSL
jgi:hypothetical protein